MLSESYLYTSEAIKESLDHLAPTGSSPPSSASSTSTNKPNRTARYVEHRPAQALERAGDRRPAQPHHRRHHAERAAGGTLSTILVKRSRSPPDEVDRFADQLDDGARARRCATRRADRRTATRSTGSSRPAATTSWTRSSTSYPYDVGPITDDGPFFWHFTPLRRRDPRLRPRRSTAATSRTRSASGCCCCCSAIAILFAAVFLLLPFVVDPQDVDGSSRARASSALYFAALGLGFMFFEITLIQRLTLFLGYPTYSLTVTLASILIFTGVGALLSERLRAPARARRAGAVRRDRRAHRSSTCSAAGDHRRAARQRRSPCAIVVAFAGARAARPVPRHVHAARPRGGRRLTDAPARVRGVGLGGQRLRLGGRLGADHDPGDDLRLQRRARLRARGLPGRDRHPARPAHGASSPEPRAVSA